MPLSGSIDLMASRTLLAHHPGSSRWENRPNSRRNAAAMRSFISVMERGAGAKALFSQGIYFTDPIRVGPPLTPDP